MFVKTMGIFFFFFIAVFHVNNPAFKMDDKMNFFRNTVQLFHTANKN